MIISSRRLNGNGPSVRFKCYSKNMWSTLDSQANGPNVVLCSELHYVGEVYHACSMQQHLMKPSGGSWLYGQIPYCMEWEETKYTSDVPEWRWKQRFQTYTSVEGKTTYIYVYCNAAAIYWVEWKRIWREMGSWENIKRFLFRFWDIK